MEYCGEGESGDCHKILSDLNHKNQWTINSARSANLSISPISFPYQLIFSKLPASEHPCFILNRKNS